MLAQMADLVLLYREPVWLCDQDARRAERGGYVSHYTWSNREMEDVYHQLEATIVAIRESYFEREREGGLGEESQ